MKQRNGIYKLSDLDIGDRFAKTSNTKVVFEIVEKSSKIMVVDVKKIDGKIGQVDKREFSKPIKECQVKFLRHVN